MYQAAIRDQFTGEPVTDTRLIHAVAMSLGCSPKREEVDAELGIWLLDLNEGAEQILERDGEIDAIIATCHVTIETP